MNEARRSGASTILGWIAGLAMALVFYVLSIGPVTWWCLRCGMAPPSAGFQGFVGSGPITSIVDALGRPMTITLSPNPKRTLLNQFYWPVEWLRYDTPAGKYLEPYCEWWNDLALP